MTRVLLVDDDVDILESTALLLELEGYDVRTVADASELAVALREFDPQVLLQDVNMPGLQIRSAVAHVRANHPDVVVILFTAAPDAASIRDELRADDLLTKPFEVADLRKRMGRAIRLRTMV